jgi:chaperonin GroES
MASEMMGNPVMGGQQSNQATDPQALAQAMPGPEPVDQQPPAEPDPEVEFDKELMSVNLAEKLSTDQINSIGNKCKTGFEQDKQSRGDWESSLIEWTKLANQTRENKSYPWPDASNVKYPILSTAAMQFAARAYPSLVPSNGQIVKSVVIGKDKDGQKLERAERVSMYMSYQILHEIDGWEEDMDKMLMMLPIVGTMFKKTFYDKNKDQIVSKLILPLNLVVNYWTKSLEECERISEVIQISKRLLKERQLQGIYLDIDLGAPSMPMDVPKEMHVVIDETTPYELVEQHTFLDLKETGYPLPYIVTFERNTGKVLRISNRFRSEDVETDEKGKITKVTPIQMYTKFGFVPNPDGSFYDVAFGLLLGSLNESVNSLVNQLIDSGSINNLQSGFIGKGLRLRQGDQRFKPGEWKPVNATGDDLRKQIVPLPTKEPSSVLLQLMQLLVTSSKELASVAEIFVGKMPGQNTPATTTMASIEQGMKVFTAVYKRIFRALASEFDKIFELNGIYLDPNKYVAVLDATVGPDDFNDDSYDICPGADPTAVSQTEKLLKAQGLMELLPSVPGLLDPVEVISRVLEAQEQPNWQRLFSKQVQQSGQLPPPPPDPKMMAIQAKMQADQQKAQTDIQAKQQQMELDSRDKQMQMAMSQQEHAQEMQHKQESAMSEAASKIAMAKIFMAAEAAKGQQTLQNNQQAHNQKMIQEKAKSEAQIKSLNAKSKTGNKVQ